MWCRLALAVAICVLAVACGGKDGDSSPSPTPSPSPNPGSGGVTIHGGERLGWDQRAPSLQELNTYTYRLYIDGVVSSLSDLRCSTTATAAGYDCSGRLPAMSVGAHTLEVATVARGVESSRGPALRVTMVSPVQAPLPSATKNEDAGQESQLCLDEGTGECYTTTVIAANVKDATGLTSTSDGRLFFIEDGTRIRVVQSGRLLRGAALSTERSSDQILSLAVEPDFGARRAVYVGVAEDRQDGARAMTILRYRELQGVFAEGAAIVTGLPVSRAALAPLTVDADGLLYVALPAASGDPSASGNALNHFILRFAADGTVPAQNPRVSPIVAHGYANPSAMAWDAFSRRIWLAGIDERLSQPVSTLSIDRRDRGDEWPAQPIAALDSRPNDGAVFQHPAVTITTSGAAADTGVVWLISAPGVVYRGALQPSGDVLRFERVGFEALGTVTAIAGGPRQSLYIASSQRSDTTGSADTIWQLTPRRR